jgi:hypothetical protein
MMTQAGAGASTGCYKNITGKSVSHLWILLIMHTVKQNQSPPHPMFSSLLPMVYYSSES